VGAAGESSAGELRPKTLSADGTEGSRVGARRKSRESVAMFDIADSSVALEP
jgi:hypothetical protein